MGDQGELRNWTENDFVDTTSAEPRDEDDPWQSNQPPTSITVATLQERQVNGPDASAAPNEADFDGLGYFDDELQEVQPDDRWSDDTFEAVDWAEPEPTVDASSELNEALYPPDLSITDITRDLKIGEFLAQVKPVTDAQRARCRALLSACGIGRLRRWIPWLRDRHWCGVRVLLFLEFRRHWESSANVRWWETFWWDPRSLEWMPDYQPGVLTLDHSGELVECRTQCPVADVIDPAWFREWEERALWKHGIRSFASFAVFRAGVKSGDDWQQLLSRQDQRTVLERAQCVDGTFAPFMLPSFAQQYGFSLDPGRAQFPWSEDIQVARRVANSGDH